MIVRAFVAAALVAAALAGPARAQTPASASTPATAEEHFFEIVDGQVRLDGRTLGGAVPDGLDLSGFEIQMAYSGPVTPVVEIDGVAYVLEDDRLVLFETSSRAGRNVYILGEMDRDPAAMPSERVAEVSREAYLRELAERDRDLYEQMEAEHALESEVLRIAATVRGLPGGPERERLRAHLHGHLSALFSHAQRVRHAELDRAQVEIEAVRRQLVEREREREAMIEGRLRRLCGEDDPER